MGFTTCLTKDLELKMKKGLYCHHLLSKDDLWFNSLSKEQTDTTRKILGKGWPLVQLALL